MHHINCITFLQLLAYFKCFLSNSWKGQTFVVRGETEDIISFFLLVTHPIIPHTGNGVFASTWLSGFGDGVLHRSVTEPPCIAPIQPVSPGIVQLVERCHNGILVSASFLSIREVQVVTTQSRKIRKHNACRKPKTRKGMKLLKNAS